MNLQTLILYSIVTVLIGSGLVPCWRSGLKTGMKLYWSLIILALPGAGTLFYMGYKDLLHDPS
jgi:hypothetical protein